MRVDAQTLTYVAELLYDYKDDLDTFWDTLDGETDVMDQVGAILVAINETKAAAQANDHLAKLYAGRKSALDHRADSLTMALKGIMLATGQEKIPHPLATVSMRQGSTRVLIVDENAIPTQLCKVTKTPDKTAIKKLLEAGENIEGAELSRGPLTVSVRMK
jgi:hypothetical protein